jgi:hypothetical protein
MPKWHGAAADATSLATASYSASKAASKAVETSSLSLELLLQAFK